MPDKNLWEREQRPRTGGGTLGGNAPVGRGVGLVRVTAGSVQDGWSVTGLRSDGTLSGLSWTRVRTMPGGAALDIDGTYGAVIDEHSRRPVVLVMSGAAANIVQWACARISGILPDNLDFDGFKPFFTFQQQDITDPRAGVMRGGGFETAAGIHQIVSSFAGVRRQDVGGIQPGNRRIVHDYMTAACWPDTPPDTEFWSGHPVPMTIQFTPDGDDSGHDGNVSMYNAFVVVFEEPDWDEFVHTQATSGWDWGTPLAFQYAKDPRYKADIYRRESEGGDPVTFDGFCIFHPVARGLEFDPGRDWSGVPYGGQDLIDGMTLTAQNTISGEYQTFPAGPPGGGNLAADEDFDGDYTEWLMRPVHPVWVCSTWVKPIVYPFLDLEDPNPDTRFVVQTLCIREQQTNTGFRYDRRAICMRSSIFWHDPFHALSHQPYALWGNWWDQIEYDAVTTPYWYGCFLYGPYGPVPGEFASNLEGVWAPAAGYANEPIAIREVFRDFGMNQISTHSDEAPGIKVDGGGQGPGFKFTAPARLRELVETHGAEAVTITASTAEAFVSGARRTEYWLECYNRARTELIGQDPRYQSGNIYGPWLRQLSSPGTSSADWKTVYKVRWTQDTDSFIKNGTDSADNSHVDEGDWRDFIFDETGVHPGGSYPNYVPKLPPFYAAGDPNAPQAVTQLEGLKCAHWLFAKQRMGAISGSGPEDTTVEPTLSHFHDYRAFGVNYSDIPEELREQYDDLQAGDYDEPPGSEADTARYEWPWAQVPTDSPILEWIREQKGQTIAGLENIDYRSLQFSPVSGVRPEEPATPEEAHYYSSVLPNDVWTECNMLDVAEALRDDMVPETFDHTWSTAEDPATFDKDHFEYEIRPGHPWRGPVNDEHTSAHDGLQRNPSLWFKSLMPYDVQIPGEGEMNGRWAFVIFGIVAQEFNVWKMRGWTITVDSPEGIETIQVPTPWD